jgi:hypothetical protein
MPQGILAGLLVAHGLITMAIGATPSGAITSNPDWLSWWPTTVGRSWLLDAVQLGNAGATASGLLWVVAGLGLAGAGLGLFGVPGLRDAWQALALAGAGLGLAAVVLYFHPWYALALLVNLAILATRAGTEHSPFAVTAV